MNRILLAGLLILLVAGCSTSQMGGQVADTRKEIIPLSGALQITRFSLDNGLRLLVVEDHSSPTIAYQTWFRVGSRNEVPGKTGLAHLFEHMMFKGTKDLKEGEFDKLLEKSGVQGENAFTSRDYTAYVQELPKDKLELIARLEADRMVNLVVNHASFKTETEVVQNERRLRYENSPDGIIYQEMFGLAFTKHPYHWPVIGYQKDLNEMSDQDAREFYRTYYSPNHATVVVVGDVDAEKVRSEVQKYYGHLPSQPTPQRVIPAEPPQLAARRKELKLNMQLEKLWMGYPVPGVLSKDAPALAVLQNVLTGSKSSRLNRALVETGIASAVDVFSPDDRDPSLAIFIANLQKGKHAQQAEGVVLKELARISKEPVPEQELARAKNKINFGFYEGLGTNNQKAHFLGQYEAVADDFLVGIHLFKQVEKVTASDVRRVAKLYLNPNRRSVIVGVPK